MQLFVKMNVCTKVLISAKLLLTVYAILIQSKSFITILLMKIKQLKKSKMNY